VRAETTERMKLTAGIRSKEVRQREKRIRNLKKGEGQQLKKKAANEHVKETSREGGQD